MELPPALHDATVEAAADVPLAPVDVTTSDATTGPADAGSPVMIPAPPHTCRPCRSDADCGDGICAAVDATMAPGLRECRMNCLTAGARCDADVPATCRLGTDGNQVCTPDVTLGCLPMTSRRGVACPASGCLGRYDLCVSLDATRPSVGRAGDVCLDACVDDADCEDGARRCRAVVLRDGRPARACVPDDRIGPDACGTGALDATGLNAPCGESSPACAAGLRCITPTSPSLHGFCSRSCTSDASCGSGARCTATADGSICVPDGCRCGFEPTNGLLDRALRADPSAGWDRCNLFFSASTLDAFGSWVTRDRFRLPVFDLVHRDWLHGVRWAEATGPALDAAATTLSGALRAAAGLRATGDTTSLRAPMPVTAPDSASPLVDAAAAWITRGGATPDRAVLTADAADVPMALQRAVASVLQAALRTADARDRGLAHFPAAEDRAHLFAVAPFSVLATNRPAERLDYADPADLSVFLGYVTLPEAEAVDLAATVEAVDWRPFAGLRDVSFTASTAAGSIVIRDGAAQRWTATEFPRVLLALDLGGDDTYEAPVAGNADANQPVSVAIDLGGDDTWAYPVVPSALDTPDVLPSDADGRLRIGGTGAASMGRTARQGSGRLGVALLYDLGAGRDTYRAPRMAQGFAALGVGGLFDDGGDDHYTVEAGGQGGATLGTAVLVDAGGNDSYATWAFAEGFGYVQGVGVLYDRAGDDTYASALTPVLYPSPQDMTANSSFTQGAGFGRRADTVPDHVNMAGGLGVLRDATGADRYTAGIFAQGTGYWSGMGMLLDGAGDDRYDARWYVQGAAAHFAFGALVDGGGHDVHNAVATRENMTAGAGHDFSLGIFVARGPEGDQYGVPNLALGAGNANGAGIFADDGGDDTYTAASSLTLGNAALETLTDPGRLARPTVGIFLDHGGADTYSQGTTTVPSNGHTWTQRIHPEATSERGFGADDDASAGSLW